MDIHSRNIGGRLERVQMNKTHRTHCQGIESHHVSEELHT